MEAGNSAAGDNDEEAGPDTQSLGMRAVEEAVHGHMGQDRVALGKESHGQADGHEDEQGCEERIDAANENVNGKNCGTDIVNEDNGRPGHERQRRDRGQQRGGTGGKDSADHDQQNQGKNDHELADAFAEVAADDFRIGCAAVTQGHHAGDEVVHGARENAAKNYPEQGGRAVQRADDGTEHRAQARDVQKLDEGEFPGWHGHIVHAVSLGHDWCGTAAVNTEDFFGDDTVDCITRYEQAKAAEKVSDTGHNKKPSL